MTAKPMSLRRRQLVIAAAATAAMVPLARAASPASRPTAAFAGGEPLLLSGRLVGRDGMPLSHASIELLPGHVRASADGDGRFMLDTEAPPAGRLRYRVVERSGRAWDGVARIAHTAVLTDETGRFRATVGLAAA